MEIQVVPSIILIVYALLTVVVANIVLKKKLGSEHFLVAARALPLSLVTAVLLGDMVGGASTIGVSQRGHTEGIVGSLYAIAIAIAFFVFASTMSARFRRLRAVTIPEVIGRLFDQRTRLTSALVIAVAYFFIGITQIMAGAALLCPMLGVDIWVGALIAAIIFALIITVGGLRSIALVNMIQVVVIYFGIIIGLLFSLKLIGGSVTNGFSRIWNELPPSFWNYSTGNVLTRFGEGFGTVLTFFAAQAAITGVFAAKDQKAAVQGTWIAGFLLVPIGFGFTFLGMAARIHFGDALPHGLAAASAMMLELNPILSGIALCGLFAAIVSTGPLNFLAPVQIFIRDVYSVYINPDADDRKLLFLSRLSAIIVVIGGWGLAVTFVEILQITYWAFAFRAGIAIILLGLTYLGTRYVSESGAFWGLIAGVIVFVIWTLAGSPFGLHVSIPSMAACLISTLIVSKIIPRKKELAPEIQEALHPKMD